MIINSPTSEIIQNVLAIGFMNNNEKLNAGSCLAYLENDVTYLFTAAHLLIDAKMSDSQNLTLYLLKEFSEDNKTVWKTFLIGHNNIKFESNLETGVAVIKMPKEFQLNTPQAKLMSENYEYIFGQDAYFLEFPYLEKIAYTFKTDSGYPAPFIKKAVVAFRNKEFIYLDGHTNKGFSGGPVIFRNCSNNKEQQSNEVMAIIIGYINHEGRINYLEPPSNKVVYMENSGIVVACDIHRAIALMKQFQNTKN